MGRRSFFLNASARELPPASRPGYCGRTVRPGRLGSVTGNVRAAVRVEGVVQGVGFRPFVYSLATRLGLAGWVGNDADGVFAEV